MGWHCSFRGLLFFLGLTATAEALPSQCRVDIRFENRTTGQLEGDYKLGIDFSKSKIRTVGGVWVPVKSKKTVWSPTLNGSRSTAKRSTKIMLNEACSKKREFKFYTCVKKVGGSKKKSCELGLKSRHGEPGEWSLTYRISGGSESKEPKMRVTVKTRTKTREARASRPNARECKMTFNIENTGFETGTFSIQWHKSKVKAKNGVWVKLPRVDWVKGPADGAGKYKQGDRTVSVAEITFREPCKRKRKFEIWACFAGNWSIPAKCNPIGGMLDGKKTPYKAGPYHFDLELKNVHGHYIHLKKFN